MATTETLAVACAHCGLPVPGAIAADPSPQFCCSGCWGVYHALHELGLEEFYGLQVAGRRASTGEAGSSMPREQALAGGPAKTCRLSR